MIEGCDMIVNLNHVPTIEPAAGIRIKRAFPGDKKRILDFVREHFSENWVYETECSMMQEVSKCFIATKDNKVLGFACYDASAKGFFSPIGVDPACRGQNIGNALLTRTLHAMYEYGYGYAIIGWVSEAEMFYRKVVGAEFIKGGNPENSVYTNLIMMD